jgi:hypothetical protein
MDLVVECSPPTPDLYTFSGHLTVGLRLPCCLTPQATHPQSAPLPAPVRSIPRTVSSTLTPCLKQSYAADEWAGCGQ